MLDTTMRRDVIERRHIQDARPMIPECFGASIPPSGDEAKEELKLNTNDSTAVVSLG